MQTADSTAPASASGQPRPAQGGFLRRRWKLIVNIITLIALGVLVYAIRDELLETFRNLFRVNAWWLLMLIPIQLLNYHAQTKMYQGLFSVLGNKLSYRFLYRISLELNFVNHVFPSGGVTGVSYFGVRMRGENISAAKASLVQVMKVALLLLSFEVLLIAGLLFLAVVGKANGLVLFVAGALSVLLIVGTILFAYIIGSKRRINIFFITLTRALNRVLQFFRRGHHPETIKLDKAHDSFDELHGNYLEFRRHYGQLQRPFYWALAANVTEIMMLYTVYIAFGELVNVGAVILAYGVANFAGLVSVLPGGVGIYEGLMTAVLAAGGVPAATSLPVTVMYRVLSTLIQIPPGYFLYQRTLAGKGKGT